MKRTFFTAFILLVFFASYSVAKAQEFVESDGVDIYYKTFGAGQPLLILNGGPGMSSEGFIPLAEKLAGNHQTILFDQRGTGQSTMSMLDSSTINMDLMVRDMEALRKHLKIDSWIILGHSFGGMLGAYYTAHHPDKVDGIIFSSSGGLDLGLLEYVDIRSKLSESERDSLIYWNRRIAEGDTSYYARLQRGKNLAPAYLYNREHIPVIAERLTQGNSTINGLIWSNLQQINFDTKDSLRTFHKPVLIIQGKQDIIIEETARIAENTLSNSKVVLLDRAVHYGWLDREEAFFDEIFSFLKQFDS